MTKNLANRISFPLTCVVNNGTCLLLTATKKMQFPPGKYPPNLATPHCACIGRHPYAFMFCNYYRILPAWYSYLISMPVLMKSFYIILLKFLELRRIVKIPVNKINFHIHVKHICLKLSFTISE